MPLAADGGSKEGGTVSSSDGGTCVNIDVSNFDTSCTADSDCIEVTPGTICAGYTCICGGASISAADQARYDALLASVPRGEGPGCNCPAFGIPRCLQSQCVLCATFPNPHEDPRCPDGG